MQICEIIRSVELGSVQFLALMMIKREFSFNSSLTYKYNFDAVRFEVYIIAIGLIYGFCELVHV